MPASLPAVVVLPTPFTPISKIMLGFVESDELDKLYRNCRFLLFPSLNEGFGLPVLEAALHLKPSVATSLSSVPEIISSIGVYVDPYSEKSIAEGLACLTDKAECERRVGYLVQKREILQNTIELDKQIFTDYFLY